MERVNHRPKNACIQAASYIYFKKRIKRIRQCCTWKLKPREYPETEFTPQWRPRGEKMRDNGKKRYAMGDKGKKDKDKSQKQKKKKEEQKKKKKQEKQPSEILRSQA